MWGSRSKCLVERDLSGLWAPDSALPPLRSGARPPETIRGASPVSEFVEGPPDHAPGVGTNFRGSTRTHSLLWPWQCPLVLYRRSRTVR